MKSWNSWRLTLLLLLLIASIGMTTLAPACRAAGDDEDPNCQYIEYREQQQLGQIIITSNFIRGTVGVNRLKRQADTLTESGIIPCTGDKPRLYYHKAKLSGHTFDTLIVVQPPTADEAADADDDEPSWDAHVIVLVDGVKKIDCGLGSINGEDMSIYGIQLFPEDNALIVTATDADGHDLALPDGVDKLDEETIITDGTFISPDDEDEPDDGPVKV